MSWLQLVIAAIIVAAVSVACTLTVTAVINDNRARTTASESYRKPEKASSSPTTTSKKSERGYLIKHIGDKAAYTKSQNDRTEIASWTATKITLDPPCKGATDQWNNYGKPKNGHFVTIDFTVQTTPQMRDSNISIFTLGMQGAWKYIEKDRTQWSGNPMNSVTANCVPEQNRLPDSIGPAVKAKGTVMFDLPSTDGYLVFDNGFEYPLG
ncbi:hypothetical protein [Bifidobacterium catulorum]|uniref:DUF4352 domain-containing protein n=1 Tax=Bifidobacterium catulorum TaxID=1630173 RepID=A0A2U2MR83_9BIFI|nr:hypothetical protein [Bifidobacterium catulorum]PWG59368.1 hypothetical protein DF200_08075 [Bifidobacterium catulorum]